VGAVESTTVDAVDALDDKPARLIAVTDNEYVVPVENGTRTPAADISTTRGSITTVVVATDTVVLGIKVVLPEFVLAVKVYLYSDTGISGSKKEAQLHEIGSHSNTYGWHVTTPISGPVASVINDVEGMDALSRPAWFSAVS